MKIGTILDQIDLGSMALPEFQRGYVWNREQVRGLMHSLYRKHPIGSLLCWVTKTEGARARGNAELAPGVIKLLLDGQQRITSLYGIINGRPPQFFDGNAQAFTGLYFHLDDQIFEFYAPVKMGDNPLWINVTELFKNGLATAIQQISAHPQLQLNLSVYINRLNSIWSITEVDLHTEDVVGDDKTVDVVVDIFNRVNSGGTKLSKGDLALARICAAWPEARAEMKAKLDKWRGAGFYFRLDWLLRNINTILTGEALFAALKDTDTGTFKAGLAQAEKAVDKTLTLISGRLGLDHDRVLGGPACFPLISRYLAQNGYSFGDHKERDKLLYWYVHSFLWGRYSGTTETVLNQDLEAIEVLKEGLDRLIERLRRNRGDLRLHANDFLGWSKGARFYPLLYMLTRVYGARDWDSGVQLSNHMLGSLSRLEVHHIFPKGLLYKAGYSRADVNAIANFTFLTQETNLLVSDRDPAEYLEQFVDKQPGAVESHWLPLDRELWKVENYFDFLEVRRELLAQAGNDFLDSLIGGSVPEAEGPTNIFDRPAEPTFALSESEEERLLRECNEWVVAQGLPEGTYNYEVADAATGAPITVFDLAWPEGLQPGLSTPTTLLIDEGPDVEEAANKAGFRFFTSISDFQEYVRQDILGLELEALET